MSRVDSVRIADRAATRIQGRDGLVLASDAFFPFADGPSAAIDAGVTAIIQPGGSMRDDEVIAAANERGARDGLHDAPPLPPLGVRGSRGA